MGGSGRGLAPLDNFPHAAPGRGRVGPKCHRLSRCPAGLMPRSARHLVAAPGPAAPVPWVRAPADVARWSGRRRAEPLGLRPSASSGCCLSRWRRTSLITAGHARSPGLGAGPGLRRRLLLRPDVVDARGRRLRLGGPQRAGGAVLRPAGGRRAGPPAPAPSGRCGWPWPGPRWRCCAADGRSAACRGVGWPSRWSTRPWRRRSRTSGRPASACCSRCWGRGSLPSCWATSAGWWPGRRWQRPLCSCWLLHYSPGSRSPDGSVRVASVQGDVPGDGTDVLADFRQVTDNHVQATVDLAVRRRGGGAATSRLRAVAGELHRRRPVRRRADPDRHRGGGRGDRRTDPGRRHGRRRPRPRDEPGHRLGPGPRRGRPLHQASPGAVRRVHPVAQRLRRQLRQARHDPARHAQRHPRGARCGWAERWWPTRSASTSPTTTASTTRSTTVPSWSSCRPATRCSSTPPRSSSSSRSPALRALELGRALVVASVNGRTGIIGPDGAVIDPAEPRTTAVIDAEVSLDSSITPGTRVGPLGRPAGGSVDGSGPRGGAARLSSARAYRRPTARSSPRPLRPRPDSAPDDRTDDEPDRDEPT